jgi:hypothetical protein
MSDEAIDLVIDFNDVAEKREFLNRVGRATGKWRIRLNRARGGRTYQQQKYYFVVPPAEAFYVERVEKKRKTKKATSS